MLKNDAPNNPVPQGFLKRVMPSLMRPIHSRMCSRAKTIPRAAVIMIQRKPPALSPARAERSPINMVKLLVRRMKVISATLVMLGNGLGQLGVTLRGKPEATRQEARVRG